jgi:hypothetical protein
VVESAGVFTAMAAAAGLAPVAILLWRGESALITAIVLLAIGALTGAAWGAMRRPTLAQTSLRADQQLRLHDLLSTALMAHRWRDEEFRNIVLAQADAICRQRSPNEILVRRLSGRAWGAIGIVSSLLLTVSMMSGGVEIAVATPARTDGVNQRASAGRAEGSDASDPKQTRLSVAARAPAPEPAKLREQGEKNGSSDDANPDSPRNGGEGIGIENQKIAIDAAGESEGRTQTARVAPMERSQLRSSGSASPDGELPATGGGALPAALGSNQETSGVQSAPGASPALQAAPWNSSGETNRNSGPAQIGSGRVPDAYRDVVREYFSVEK